MQIWTYIFHDICIIAVNFKYPWAPGKAISVEDSVIYCADEETTSYREQGIVPSWHMGAIYSSYFLQQNRMLMKRKDLCKVLLCGEILYRS